MEKLLPQNIEAERGVLGSVIIDPDALYHVIDFLAPDMFYRDAHRTLYQAMCALHSRREPADFIALCDELERRNELEDTGGASYITSLINQVPTSGNVAYYGRIVERTAILRRLIHAAGEIAAIAYDEVEANLALEKAESLICAISQSVEQVGHASGPVTMSEAMMRLIRHLEAKEDRADITTGFTDLDYQLGGLQPQELYVIGGRPGEGKTSLMLNIIYNLWEKKTRMAMFSMEMSLVELMRRLVSMHTHLNGQALRSRMLYADDWQKIIAAAGDFDCNHIYFDETPALTIAQIRSRSRRIQMQHGLDLIMVDYLQLAKGIEDTGKRGTDRRLEVDEIANGLKALAKELNVPVIASASLKRSDKADGAAPQLSDLRESGGIDFAIDVGMFIRRSREQPGVSIINIEKHRNGPVTDGRDYKEIRLKFDPALTRFVNMPGEMRDRATAEQRELYVESDEEVA